MKFKIEKQDLITSIDKVIGAVDNRPNIPILSGILIKADNDDVTFEATNLNIRMRTHTQASISESGSMVVPAKKFTSIVKSLSGSEISIELKDNIATIKGGRSKFKINCQESKDWPISDDFGESLDFLLNSSTLKDLLKSVMSASSSDETRAALNGVLFDIKPNLLKCVATDGRRIAINETIIDTPIETQCIVPTKTINEVIKNVAGDVKVSVFDSCVMFTSHSVSLESKIIEANYPNYSQIIPKTSPSSVDLDRKSVLDSIKRVSVILNDASESVKLDFEASGDLIISASSGVDLSSESVPCAINQDLSIKFNPTFLMDGLNSSPSNEVTLKYTDNIAPCILTDNGNFTYVVMPMRG